MHRVTEAHAMQQLLCAAADLVFLTKSLGEGQGCRDEAGPDIPPRAEHGVVENRQGRQKARLLKRPRNPNLRPPLDRVTGQPLVPDQDFASVWSIVARD